MRTLTIVFTLLATILTARTGQANELDRVRAAFVQQVSVDLDITESPCYQTCLQELINNYNQSYGTSFTPAAITQQISHDAICLRTSGPGATSYGYRLDKITYTHHSLRCIARAIHQLGNMRQH